MLIHPGSILHAMFSGRFDTKPDKDGTYFIDRDGTHFRYILNYLRTRELIVPDDKTVHYEMQSKATFFEVEGIIKALTPILFQDLVILSSDQGQTLMNCCKDATLGWKVREKQRARVTRRKTIQVPRERDELERPRGNIERWYITNRKIKVTRNTA